MKYPRSRSKYGNRKTYYNGKWYPSIAEASRAKELNLLQRVGEITDLREQVYFELVPKQKDDEEVLEPVGYKADFVYLDKDGKRHVEDVKGVRTQVYNIKKKLMRWVHKIKIEEV